MVLRRPVFLSLVEVRFLVHVVLRWTQIEATNCVFVLPRPRYLYHGSLLRILDSPLRKWLRLPLYMTIAVFGEESVFLFCLSQIEVLVKFGLELLVRSRPFNNNG